MNGYNNDDQYRVSDRDRLERDEHGNLRGNQRMERERSQGRGGGFGGNRQRGGDNKGTKKALFAIALLVILVIIGMGSSGNGFSNFFRTFNSTPEENLTSFFTSVKKLEADNKREGEPYTVYDHNNIYGDEGITKMVDKEYAVYVYTDNEKKNEPFNSWVQENEGLIPIYRVDINMIGHNAEVISYKEDDTPMVLIYNETERGLKELEGVIKDPELLGEVVPYIEKIISEKDGIAEEEDGE